MRGTKLYYREAKQQEIKKKYFKNCQLWLKEKGFNYGMQNNY